MDVDRGSDTYFDLDACLGQFDVETINGTKQTITVWRHFHWDRSFARMSRAYSFVWSYILLLRWWWVSISESPLSYRIKEEKIDFVVNFGLFLTDLLFHFYFDFISCFLFTVHWTGAIGWWLHQYLSFHFMSPSTVVSVKLTYILAFVNISGHSPRFRSKSLTFQDCSLTFQLRMGHCLPTIFFRIHCTT